MCLAVFTVVLYPLLCKKWHLYTQLLYSVHLSRPRSLSNLRSALLSVCRKGWEWTRVEGSVDVKTHQWAVQRPVKRNYAGCFVKLPICDAHNITCNIINSLQAKSLVRGEVAFRIVSWTLRLCLRYRFYCSRINLSRSLYTRTVSFATSIMALLLGCHNCWK